VKSKGKPDDGSKGKSNDAKSKDESKVKDNETETKLEQEIKTISKETKDVEKVNNVKPSELSKTQEAETSKDGGMFKKVGGLWTLSQSTPKPEAQPVLLQPQIQQVPLYAPQRQVPAPVPVAAVPPYAVWARPTPMPIPLAPQPLGGQHNPFSSVKVISKSFTGTHMYQSAPLGHWPGPPGPI